MYEHASTALLYLPTQHLSATIVLLKVIAEVLLRAPIAASAKTGLLLLVTTAATTIMTLIDTIVITIDVTTIIAIGNTVNGGGGITFYFLRDRARSAKVAHNTIKDR